MSIMKKVSDQECRGEIKRLKLTFNILDQINNIILSIWLRFEVNVFK